MGVCRGLINITIITCEYVQHMNYDIVMIDEK